MRLQRPSSTVQHINSTKVTWVYDVAHKPFIFMVIFMANVSAKILLFATLREKYGIRELEAKCDGTVRNLIEGADKTLDKGFLDRIYDIRQNKVREDLIFTINGRNIKDIKGGIEIKEGDRVAIFPPLAGG